MYLLSNACVESVKFSLNLIQKHKKETKQLYTYMSKVNQMCLQTCATQIWNRPMPARSQPQEWQNHSQQVTWANAGGRRKTKNNNNEKP